MEIPAKVKCPIAICSKLIKLESFAHHMDIIHGYATAKCPICTEVHGISKLKKHIRDHKKNQPAVEIGVMPPDIDFFYQNEETEVQTYHNDVGSPGDKLFGNKKTSS